MDITLYEKINRERLREVLCCDNIPFGDEDEPEWKQNFIKILKIYYNKKPKKQGIEVKYKQTHKYGRYFSNNGLQGFQRDVRKYLCDGNMVDIDIVNAHPIILEQLFEKYEIFCDSSLKKYNNDRASIMKEFGFEDKIGFIKFINNDRCSNNKLEKLHSYIYNLVDVLIKDNKPLFQRLKKERVKGKKDYNYKGCFISHYLQNIENDILMVMYKYCNSKGFIVSTLCFDGLMIEKTEDIKEDHLRDMEEIIEIETGFKINLVFKSMKTDWAPNQIEDYESKLNDDINLKKYSKETGLRLSNIIVKNENGNVEVDEYLKGDFYEYMNNFLCFFEKPHTFGWRSDIKYDFQFLPSYKIREVVGVNAFDVWNCYDDRKKYYTPVFKIENKHMKEGEYNLYRKPKMIQGDIPEIFFDYLKRIVCSNNEDLFEYILTYFSILLKTGRTNQCIVLMGDRGIGKSTFIEFARDFVGKDYYNCVNNIERLTSQFNSIYEKSIVTGVEEVVNNAGEYFKVQNMLKTLITEKTKPIEKKGIDSYIVDCFNNFIICTNNVNPVQITVDNRRYCIVDVNPIERKNRKYFGDLKECIDKNIEAIRYFFYNRPINNDLEIIRPTTIKEAELVEINLSSDIKFIRYEMVLSDKRGSFVRSFSRIYGLYKEYCLKNGEKGMSSKYFSASLKKEGYETYRYGKSSSLYIDGITEKQDVSDDDDDIVSE